MAMILRRSRRTEDLVAWLCEDLASHWPADPFQAVPIVVGSRGMERWLRHEIATERGVAAQLAFPFPRQALDGAAAWLLDPQREPLAPFWEHKIDASPWSGDGLGFRVVPALRAQLAHPDFAAVARYLENGGAGPLGARELRFAAEVAEVLDRLVHDRPEESLAWATAPDEAPAPHRWLARLLADLGASDSAQGSPAWQYARLCRLRPAPPTRRLFLFGLSTLGPGDRARLELLAHGLHIHLYLLAPSEAWWADIYSKREACRALRKATSPADLARLEGELASHNPLLAGLGLPSRDLQSWLESLDPNYDDTPPCAPPAATDRDSTLGRLQQWVAEAAPLPAQGDWAVDDSLRFHSAFGALRQCETLRDELLALFAAKDAPEPRDVVVMTPDIETYAPLVAAVFARRGPAAGPASSLPAIPVAIADLGLRRTNPVAEVLLQLLELAGERLTANRLLDFLGLGPVAQRFDLDADGLADLRDMVSQSGLRWALDAEDREGAGQPALDQNTIRFGLERLALGVLMPDEEAETLGSLPERPPGLGPAVPLPLESRDRVERFGKLAALVRQLAHVRQRFAAPATLATWRERLTEALDALSATSAKTAWLRREVDERVESLARAAAAMDDTPLTREALLRHLSGGFEISQRGDRPITGAVTVCSLEPMRSVPFRVVALLGMDDERFPRGGQPRSWDPFASPRPGERDRRAVDRHLLLEALLSARDHVLVLWSGRDVQSGEHRPAAVPVEEFLETLGALTGQPRDSIVRPGSLQPWSAANFPAGSDEGSFDAAMAAAARGIEALRRGEAQPAPRGLEASGDEALPPEEEGPRALSLDNLAWGLLQPQRLLLNTRLGLRLARSESALPDREPLELDGLEAWRLRDRLLPSADRELDDEAILDRFQARMAGEGVLPLARGGRQQLRAELAAARVALANLAAAAGEPGERPLILSLRLDDGAELMGTVARQRRRGDELLLEWLTSSKEANDRTQLCAWLHLLAAAAQGEPVVGARLVGTGDQARKARGAQTARTGGTFLAWQGSADEARDLLQELYGLWREARQRPLPLFRHSSRELAAALAGGQSPTDDKTLRALRAAWEGDANSSGEREDPWVAPLFGRFDAVAALSAQGTQAAALAGALWQPFQQALAQGGALATEWIFEEEGGEA